MSNPCPMGIVDFLMELLTKAMKEHRHVQTARGLSGEEKEEDESDVSSKSA